MFRTKRSLASPPRRLSVTEHTVILEGPENVTLTHYQDVRFDCVAQSDPSTPVTYRWLLNGAAIQPGSSSLVLEPNNSLRILTEDEADGGEEYVGEYTCVASNGYSEDRRRASLFSPKGTVIPTGNIRVKVAKIIKPVIFRLCALFVRKDQETNLPETFSSFGSAMFFCTAGLMPLR